MSVEVGLAAFVQDRLLKLTNQNTPFAYVSEFFTFRIELAIFYAIAISLVLVNYRWRIPRRFLLYLELCWLVSVAILQLVNDIKEIQEVKAGIVREWNYRWAESDPSWWAL